MRDGWTRYDRITQGIGALQLATGVLWVVFDDAGFGILLATLGLLTAARPWRDRAQYNAGWMSGRASFVLSMMEAQRRGMSPVEWIVAEAERDGVLVVEAEGGTDEQ